MKKLSIAALFAVVIFAGCSPAQATKVPTKALPPTVVVTPTQIPIPTSTPLPKSFTELDVYRLRDLILNAELDAYSDEMNCVHALPLYGQSAAMRSLFFWTEDLQADVVVQSSMWDRDIVDQRCTQVTAFLYLDEETEAAAWADAQLYAYEPDVNYVELDPLHFDSAATYEVAEHLSANRMIVVYKFWNADRKTAERLLHGYRNRLSYFISTSFYRAGYEWLQK